MSQLRARCAILVAVVGPSCSDKRDAVPAVAPAKVEPATGIDKRADELIAKMTLEEKLGQLNQYSSGHTGIGGEHVSFEKLIAAGQLGSVLMVGAKEINQLQHVAMERSRLHIPVLFAWDVIHGYRCLLYTSDAADERS